MVCSGSINKATLEDLDRERREKTTQHLEGGIVRSLHVSEGQLVTEGDLLLALDPLQASAMVARHNGQLDQALAMQARLNSELVDDEFLTLDGALLNRIAANPEVAKIVESEERHFFARRETREGHLTILRQRIEQLANEIRGLTIQRAARLEQLKIFKDELVGLRELFEKGFYPKTKILAVERAISDLGGRR